MRQHRTSQKHNCCSLSKAKTGMLHGQKFGNEVGVKLGVTFSMLHTLRPILPRHTVVQ